MFCLLIKDSLFFLPSDVISIQRIGGMKSKCRTKTGILTIKCQQKYYCVICCSTVGFNMEQSFFHD